MAQRTVKFINKESGLLLDGQRFSDHQGVYLTHPDIGVKILKKNPSGPSRGLGDTQQWLIDSDRVITNYKDGKALTYDAAAKKVSLQPVTKQNNQKWTLHIII